jgi:hypothetical protein
VGSQSVKVCAETIEAARAREVRNLGSMADVCVSVCCNYVDVECSRCGKRVLLKRQKEASECAKKEKAPERL